MVTTRRRSLRRMLTVEIPYSAAPIFAYSATLTGPSGEATNDPGEGRGLSTGAPHPQPRPGHGTQGRRHPSEQDGTPDLSPTRTQSSSEALAPSSEQEVEFEFDIRNGEPVESYELELVIYDSYSGASLSRRLDIRSRRGSRATHSRTASCSSPPTLEAGLSRRTRRTTRPRTGSS